MREGPTLLPGPAQNLGACGRTSCKSDPWGLTPWPRPGRPAGGRPRLWGSGQRHCPSVPVAAPLFSLLESQAEICRVTSGRPPLIGPGAVGRAEGGGQCPAQHTPTHPGGRCPPAPTFPCLRARTSPAPCWPPVVSLVLELGVGPGRCLGWAAGLSRWGSWRLALRNRTQRRVGGGLNHSDLSPSPLRRGCSASPGGRGGWASKLPVIRLSSPCVDTRRARHSAGPWGLPSGVREGVRSLCTLRAASRGRCGETQATALLPPSRAAPRWPPSPITALGGRAR